MKEAHGHVTHCKNLNFTGMENVCCRYVQKRQQDQAVYGMLTAHFGNGLVVSTVPVVCWEGLALLPTLALCQTVVPFAALFSLALRTCALLFCDVASLSGTIRWLGAYGEQTDPSCSSLCEGWSPW